MTTEYTSETEAEQALRGLLLPAWGMELERLNRIDRWWRWNPKPVRLKQATLEHHMLRDLGVTPWLRLVVTTISQTLYLEGVDIPGKPDTESARIFWHPWVANRMGRRQVALHKAAIAYGTAYAAVRADASEDGGTRAVIECYSPRESIAVYDDAARDTFPQSFMRVRRISPQVESYELWDKWNIWQWTRENGAYTLVSCTPHLAVDAYGNPVCPVVRYTNDLDLQGRAPGEVEPYIPLAGRLNKDNYDRLLAQHYNSWKVRTVTGLDMTALNDQQRSEKKLQLRQDDLLAGGEGVQFGALPETTLSSLIEAKQADVEELAAVSQTPTTAFGKMVNVGDAGIAESRAGFYAKRDERQKSFGVSHMDVLRLCAGIEGRMDDAHNFDLTPIWEDTDVRTINQAVDALGKAAQMLGVPKQELWDMIPGVSKSRADSWREYADAHPDADALAVQAYQAQLNPVGVDDGADQ
ncbi:phage portal protein [Bifidobacterium imperatoris]|uniref:Phage portal protein n=1 Tax=Bifidobacterium imperatoris TaxID=2020965 RepID=A0ABX7S6C0_9BIFI|nr:phage portal protein [Bifidobacterium imperatoris]